MRLFVAICFDQSLKLRLSRLIGELSKNAEHGNFTRVQNLHMTLQFIGETQNTGAAQEALACVSFKSFQILFDRVSGFKRQGSEICFLGVKDAGELKALSEAVGRELKGRGFKLEERPFVAHLTLGREVIFKKGFEPEKTIIPEYFKSSADKISLMKSERVKGVLTYTEIFSKSAEDI